MRALQYCFASVDEFCPYNVLLSLSKTVLGAGWPAGPSTDAMASWHHVLDTLLVLEVSDLAVNLHPCLMLFD